MIVNYLPKKFTKFFSKYFQLKWYRQTIFYIKILSPIFCQKFLSQNFSNSFPEFFSNSFPHKNFIANFLPKFLPPKTSKMMAADERPTMEPLLQGKAQYHWPPGSSYFKSNLLTIENFIHLFSKNILLK